MGKELRSGSSSSTASSSKSKMDSRNRADDSAESQPLMVSAVQSSGGSNDPPSMVKEMLPYIKGFIDDLQTKVVQGIKDEIINILHDEIKSLRDSLSIAENEITVLKTTVNDQSTELIHLRKEIDNLKENGNARERHSRSWNLVWVSREEEKTFEQPDDTENLVMSFINQVPEIKKRNVQIDVAHRIGKKFNDKPRPIIVRFIKKSDLWFVLKHRKELIRQNKGPIFQDLTKHDRLTKKKYHQEISQLVNGGHQAKFQNGRWIIDGKTMTDNDFKKLQSSQ